MTDDVGHSLNHDRPNYAVPPPVDGRRTDWPRPEASGRRSIHQTQKLRVRIALGAVAVVLAVFVLLLVL